MEFLPVGKRTRGQKAKMLKEQNKKACLAARKKWKERKEKSLEVHNSNGGKKIETLEEDDYDHDAVVIDEDEYLKAINDGGSEKTCESEGTSIIKKEVFDYDDDDNDNHENPLFNVVNGDESGDDSLQILGERWNPLAAGMCCDSDDEDKVGVSGEKVAPTDFEISSSEEDDSDVSDENFVVENPEGSVSESSSSNDNSVEEVDEKDLDSKDAKFAHVHDDDDDGAGGFKSSKHDRKGKKQVLGVNFRNRKPASPVNDDDDDGDNDNGGSDGVKSFKHDRKGKKWMLGDKFQNRVPASPVKDDDDDDDNGGSGGTKSFKHDRKRKERVLGDKVRNGVPASPVKHALKKSLIAEKTEKESKLGSISRTITVDVEETASTSSSSSFNDDDNDNDNGNANVNKNGEGLRNCNGGGKRKRERPALRKEPKKRLQVKEAETILLNTILENGSAAGLEGTVPSMKHQDDLPRKFRLGGGEVVPQKSEYEQELEVLFKELDFGLGVCDIGLEHSSLYDKKAEEAVLCDSVASQEKLCREGKHYLILDEEIGIKCKFCSFLMLEIRDVTPAFNENPFGRSSRYCGRFPYDQNSFDKFQFPESNYDLGGAHEGDTRGTVWDLIPGIKGRLYEHQQQGFEFIWRNISGGIQIEELDKPSKYGVGGCIICHAPGTGKTRLAIVFLQSYLKQYPISKPVIIAPSSMLLTWEEEFARWSVDIPFLNLNSSELSNREIEVLGFVGDVKGSKAVRKAKLCIWAMGKGVLGISYTLFEKLAGERKGTEERVKRALLEQPGLLFLDEGHKPRNDESNIWKVFSEVHTKKRVILSGTPFQNNFDELNNTLSLIREEFRDPFIRRNYVKRGRKSKAERRDFYSSKLAEERRIEELRNQMKPFVHVHKGEILRKTLRGLFHSVLVLKPSDVQKKCFHYLSGIKNGLCLDHLVCIASVHPFLLCRCNDVPDLVDKNLLNKYKTDLEAGVKVKFLLELIKLSKGEKVLVFSQFLRPLEFIGEWLQLYFNWTEGKEYLFMEGKQRTTQRQSLIGIFNDPKSEARVLLASTKTCSEGIHLVGASRVVLLDVVWNPSVERQAISRAYRLGQKKDVYVYHLIISDTQEGEKYYRQVAKDRVSKQVFTSSEGEGGQKTSTLSRVSEDRILEEMVQHEKLKYMFEKIIYQPKVDKLIESFAPLNL